MTKIYGLLDPVCKIYVCRLVEIYALASAHSVLQMLHSGAKPQSLPFGAVVLDNFFPGAQKLHNDLGSSLVSKPISSYLHRVQTYLPDNAASDQKSSIAPHHTCLVTELPDTRVSDIQIEAFFAMR